MIPMRGTPEIKDSSQEIRRISWLTLLLGTIAAVSTGCIKSPRAGFGIAIGTILSWVNFRWLHQSVGGLVTIAQAQAGTPQARVPPSVYWKFAGRYVLIGLAIYVSVHYFAVPVVTVIVGLLALGAGAMVGSIYGAIRDMIKE
jgi:hypothetical protein